MGYIRSESVVARALTYCTLQLPQALRGNSNKLRQAVCRGADSNRAYSRRELEVPVSGLSIASAAAPVTAFMSC